MGMSFAINVIETEGYWNTEECIQSSDGYLTDLGGCFESWGWDGEVFEMWLKWS